MCALGRRGGSSEGLKQEGRASHRRARNWVRSRSYSRETPPIGTARPRARWALGHPLPTPHHTPCISADSGRIIPARHSTDRATGAYTHRDMPAAAPSSRIRSHSRERRRCESTRMPSSVRSEGRADRKNVNGCISRNPLKR